MDSALAGHLRDSQFQGPTHCPRNSRGPERRVEGLLRCRGAELSRPGLSQFAFNAERLAPRGPLGLGKTKKMVTFTAGVMSVPWEEIQWEQNQRRAISVPQLCRKRLHSVTSEQSSVQTVTNTVERHASGPDR